MPRKKTRSPKIPPGWRKSEYTQLKKDIANYNKRIRRAQNKGTGDYIDLLPSLTSVAEMFSLPDKQSIKKAQRELKKYTSKTLKPTLFNNVVVPLFQIKNIRENIRKENIRREEIKQNLQSTGQRGRFISQEDVDTRPIEEEKLTPDRIKKLASLEYTPVIDSRTVKFQENYINKLLEIGGLIKYMSLDSSLQDESIDAIEEITEIVQNLTPEQFYVGQMTVPDVNIQVLYPPEAVPNRLSAILRGWQGVSESY